MPRLTGTLILVAGLLAISTGGAQAVPSESVKVNTVAGARAKIAAVTPDARFFSRESLDALGVKVKSVSIIDPYSAAATISYEPFDGTVEPGHLSIGRAPVGDAASSFESPECSNRVVSGPLTLGPYVAWHANCDLEMSYRFNVDGYLYVVAGSYHGGLNAPALGVALSGITPVSSSLALPTLLKSPSRSNFRLKPSEIVLGAGSGAISGRGKHRSRKSKIKWLTWTETAATARARIWFTDCRPSCGQGMYGGYDATIRAFRPIDGHFTRLRITYSGKTPRRAFWRGTVELEQANGNNYWD